MIVDNWFHLTGDRNGNINMTEVEIYDLLPILADKIELLLVDIGQSDARFKLGETIRYSPSEVKHILLGDYKPKQFEQEESK